MKPERFQSGGPHPAKVPPRRALMRLMLWVVCLTAAPLLAQRDASAAAPADSPPAVAAELAQDNATCLACHGGTQTLEVPDEDGDPRPLLAIEKERFVRSVHGDMTCVDCHREIGGSSVPHRKTAAPKPDCVTCHQALWDAAREQNLSVEKARLGLVVQNAAAYENSFHARPSGRSGVKAACEDCHNSHFFDVPPRGTSKRTDWHLTVPNVCGQCHEDAVQEFANSVHGKEVSEKHNPKAAVCTDCHTTHAIEKTRKDSFKLLITQQCGNCHQEQFATYRDTYHGQINTLGYAFTAKCFDCHGSHEILRVKDPESAVHPDNRLDTCRECHDGKKMMEATEGLLSFGPHASAHDFERYPQLWIASKFMHGLFLFVFAYFWAHSLLWWYREYRDRKERRSRPRVCADELVPERHKQVHRFGRVWRIGHLVFALSVMTLILTGMALHYSYTAWAPVVISALGGPQMAGMIHRVSATIMLGIFFVHLFGVGMHVFRKRETFRWFGPDSLVPNWKDFRDAWGMFKWFVGKGPRPLFDRWTYWEKFDYWAVFWGMAVIGGSGAMLAFPDVTARYLPGWVFNVVTLVHGEEAFLAAVFLFTVHFFNNHFRPDKLPPPDIVMFTGTQSLEEFRRDHALQYQRLVENGQLEKYLVDAPSKPMTLGSKILGLLLIACGLALLTIVAIGFFSGYTPHSAALPPH